MNKAAVAAFTAAAAAAAGAAVAEDIHRVQTSGDAAVEQGRRVYQQYCASCHGSKGEGTVKNWQEPDVRGEMPPPPHGPEGHTWKHADAMLYRMIEQGWRDPFNKTQRLTMPAFGEVLSPQQIRAVIAYLKTLWTPEQQKFQREETQARGGFAPAAKEEDVPQAGRGAR